MRGNFFGLKTFGLLCGFLSFCFANPFSDFNLEPVPHTLYSEDGTRLTSFSWLHQDPAEYAKKRPVILLGHGLGETAQSLDGWAAIFYQAGFNVYIGQIRLAGFGEHVSDLSKDNHNGIKSVVSDFRSLLRFVGTQHPHADLHYFGHSMGGIEPMIAFSDKNFQKEFAHRLKAQTFLGSPSDLRDLPAWMKVLVRGLFPVLTKARRSGKHHIGVHHSFFRTTDWMEKQVWWSPAVALYGKLLSKSTLAVARMLLHYAIWSRNYHGDHELDEFMKKQISQIPIDLLLDFGSAVLNGEFIDELGLPMIVPENIEIPTQIIAVQKDIFVSRRSAEGLYQRLGTSKKQLVWVHDMAHNDLVVGKPQKEIAETAVHFHREVSSNEFESGVVELKPVHKYRCRWFLLQERVSH
ncbi:MAG: alpha/beta hydrolase [Bacteriovoracia bacterium]